uniref:Uncharacterized protein n=1 Tax=Junco hyemalis TaxID=40217 RepID=A0A8C5JRF0_JUNHY
MILWLAAKQGYSALCKVMHTKPPFLQGHDGPLKHLCSAPLEENDPEIPAWSDPKVPAWSDPKVPAWSDPEVPTSTDPEAPVWTDPGVPAPAWTHPKVPAWSDPEVPAWTDPKVPARSDPEVPAWTDPKVPDWSDPEVPPGLFGIMRTKTTGAVWEPRKFLWLPWRAPAPPRGLRDPGTEPKAPVPLI